ncbi:MAG: hypothetical protein JRE40_08830 [Deltaproteobacteria bacterium]|nr:hypothetical protein [Deltaproteobacteria bacterium]
MRKLLIALLALGLVFAFTAPAFATDASFSGYYRLRGFSFDNQAVADDSMKLANSSNKAWYDQRLRVQVVFKVAEGLSVTGRFHAMDRKWGQYETLNVKTSSQNWQQDNIYWHRAYMTFKTAIGKFDAGYQSGGTWGTVYGDGEADGRARIKYTGVFGPVIALALTEKFKERDYLDTNNDTNEDWDSYALAAIYKWDGGNAGLLLYYLVDHSNTAPAAFGVAGSANKGSTTNLIPIPYFKANFGPLYMEGEFIYFYGETDYDSAAVQDVDWKGKGWYLYGKFNMGPAYVGAQYAFREGDDPTTNDYEAGYPGSDYNPCVLLWNDNTSGLGGKGTFNSTSDGIANGSLAQIFAGFSPMENLSLKASVTYAWADYCAAGTDDEIGTEVDVEATYKIFDNLEYWIGFGYLSAGDWFKAGVATNKVDDAWLIMHKLQMNF